MPGPSFRDKSGKGTGLKYPTGKTSSSGAAKTTSKPSKAYTAPTRGKGTPLAAVAPARSRAVVHQQANQQARRVKRRKAVAHEVQRREKAVKKFSSALKKTGTKIDSGGTLGPRQEKFSAEVAKRVPGLSPRVVAGVARSEQPPDSPSIEGSDNWLNIGYNTSGPTSTTAARKFFGGPKKAAALTADFLKGKELGASEGIQNIAKVAKAGGSEAEQVKAWQTSGWADTGHPSLPEYTSDMKVEGGKKAKPIKRKLVKAGKKLGVATLKAEEVGLKKVAKQPVKKIRAEAKAAVKGEPVAEGPGGHPFKGVDKQVANPGKIINPKWDPDDDAHTMTRLAKGISKPVKKWSKKYDVLIGATYDPEGGHVSAGHNVEGTATDVYPMDDSEAGWDKLEKGLGVLTSQGFEVLYDGAAGTTAYDNHGRNNHAHIEWVGQGSADDALTKLAGVSGKKLKKIAQPGAGGGSAPLGSGATTLASSGAAGATAAAPTTSPEGTKVKRKRVSARSTAARKRRSKALALLGSERFAPAASDDPLEGYTPVTAMYKPPSRASS